MNAHTHITGSAAKLLQLRGTADEAKDTEFPDFDNVTLFFAWDFDRDRKYFLPDTKLLGALLYGNDTGEVEAVIDRKEAVARWGVEFVQELETDSAERAE